MGRFAGYGIGSFRKDLISGVIVGIISIPLGMAFAIASGVKPEYGLYTTIIAGIIISLAGGTRFQIGGPTGAFIPILLAIVMQYGYENLLIAGLLAGIMLVIIGLFKLGTLVKYIPRPVTVGFTAGIAVIIFSGQITNFLGLENVERHEYFFMNMKEIVANISSINVYSVIVAVISLATVILTAKLFPKIPGSLLGIVVSTVAAVLLFRGEIATIGSIYGNIPASLPEFKLPELTWESIQMMLMPALMIAMLGGIESLLSAVVADSLTGTRHNSNRELIGQGLANIVTPLFGGIPATGAIARTATNIKSGAVTPIAGVIHSIVVLLVLLLFAPYASHIPLASMAPILMVVAWNMSGTDEFIHLAKTKTTDSLVLLVTFLLTVFTSLTIAIPVGLVLAAILFVKKQGEHLTVTKVSLDVATQDPKASMISMYAIEGPLFFGSSNALEKSTIGTLPIAPKVWILQMDKVPYMDTTGAAYLSTVVHYFKKNEALLLISGIQRQPLNMLKVTGLYNVIGEDHLFEQVEDAIQYALQDESTTEEIRQTALV